MIKRLILFTHYLIILTAILLPFVLNWKLFILVVLAYHLIITKGIGYCPLTLWQFGSAETGFIEKHLSFILNSLNIKISRPRLQSFIRYGIPLLLITIAIAYQEILT